MGDAPVDRDQREHQVLGFAPLGSRLRPPRAQVELFRRRALVEALLQTTASLVLVSAPAGAGKSTALAQWTREDRRPTAWLQLDEADDDPVVPDRLTRRPGTAWSISPWTATRRGSSWSRTTAASRTMSLTPC